MSPNEFELVIKRTANTFLLKYILFKKLLRETKFEAKKKSQEIEITQNELKRIVDFFETVIS